MLVSLLRHRSMTILQLIHQLQRKQQLPMLHRVQVRQNKNFYLEIL
jgi:hypothetical protein